ncbi:MAG: hypothetical protein WD135_00020 [Ferruginibacter sp.]
MSRPHFLSIFYKWRFLIALFFAAMILLLQSCKKDAPAPTVDLLQQYFEENVLNRDFKVSLATDNGTNLTSQYNGWLFRLLKNTYTDGPMTAVNNGQTYTGTWSCTNDYGKLTINITQPSIPTGFSFLNRAWRFTKKDILTMELAPWGSTDPIVLHMQRQ